MRIMPMDCLTTFEDMTISLIGGYRYKFECSMVQNDDDTIIS